MKGMQFLFKDIDMIFLRYQYDISSLRFDTFIGVPYMVVFLRVHLMGGLYPLIANL